MSTNTFRPAPIGASMVFQKALNKPLDASLAVMSRVTQQIPSNNKIILQAYLTKLGRFTEWIDEVTFQDVFREEFEVSTKKYGAAVRMSNDDVDDMKDTGEGDVVRIYARQAGDQARMTPWYQAAKKMAAGKTELSPIDKAAQFSVRPNCNNVVSGTGTTLANIKTDLTTVYGRMRTFEDPNQKGKLGITPKIIYCDPILVPTFSEIANSQAGQGTSLNSGATNFYRAYEIYGLDDLGGTNDWIACADPAKFDYSMFWLNRRSPVFMLGDDGTKDATFYIGKVRLVVIFGWYFTACIVEN